MSHSMGNRCKFAHFEAPKAAPARADKPSTPRPKKGDDDKADPKAKPKVKPKTKAKGAVARPVSPTLVGMAVLATVLTPAPVAEAFPFTSMQAERSSI